MEEIIRQIFTYARGMWKHRWLGVAVMALVSIRFEVDGVMIEG